MIRLTLLCCIFFCVSLKAICQDSLANQNRIIKANVLFWPGIDYEVFVNDAVSLTGGTDAMQLFVKGDFRLKSRFEFRFYLDELKEWYVFGALMHRYRFDDNLNEAPVMDVFSSEGPRPNYNVKMHSYGLGWGLGYQTNLFRDNIALDLYTRLEKYVYTHFQEIESDFSGYPLPSEEQSTVQETQTFTVTNKDKRKLAKSWSSGFCIAVKLGYRF